MDRAYMSVGKSTSRRIDESGRRMSDVWGRRMWTQRLLYLKSP